MPQRLLFRPDKFQIACLFLLHTFDVGRQLICRFYQLPQAGILLLLFENAPIAFLHLLWQHAKKGLGCLFLYVLISILNFGIVVFNRGGHITGNNLCGIMIEAEDCRFPRIERPAKAGIAYDCQSMGYHRYLQAVFTQILIPGITHQCPAVDVFHP